MKIDKDIAQCIMHLSDGIANSSRPEDRKTASGYLSNLAPLLAQSVLGRDIIPDLESVERLLGQTWIIDSESFEQFFESWRRIYEEHHKHKTS